MNEETNTDGATLAEEKKLIEADQDLHKNEIIEVDEAAGSAEGMDTREDNILSEDVAEDRDATPPEALDISDEEIIR